MLMVGLWLVGSPPAAQKDAYNAGEGKTAVVSTGLIDLRSGPV